MRQPWPSYISATTVPPAAIAWANSASGSSTQRMKRADPPLSFSVRRNGQAASASASGFSQVRMWPQSATIAKRLSGMRPAFASVVAGGETPSRSPEISRVGAAISPSLPPTSSPTSARHWAA